MTNQFQNWAGPRYDELDQRYAAIAEQNRLAEVRQQELLTEYQRYQQRSHEMEQRYGQFEARANAWDISSSATLQSMQELDRAVAARLT